MNQKHCFLAHKEVERKISKMLPQVPNKRVLIKLIDMHMRICHVEFHPNNMGYYVRCKLDAVNGRNGLNHEEFITVYNSIFDAL
jgi:hypothetical protein